MITIRKKSNEIIDVRVLKSVVLDVSDHCDIKGNIEGTMDI